ncbi:hypothetical protein [Clostridioides sp. ZZV14-6387]|uniref:hypothetical protein n=1 Tax=Clostridioides sp. ZZV14-6387 TaxID=2811497 RepID=UPI001D10BE6E|nr:hypothetical protein [Clostridioides sp. ZZV14-6387]
MDEIRIELDKFDLKDLCKSYNNNKIKKEEFAEKYKYNRKVVKEYLIEKVENNEIISNNNRYFYTKDMQKKVNKIDKNANKEAEIIAEEEQINVKISNKLKKKLDYICNANNISFKDLINNVLEEYANKQKPSDLISKLEEKHTREIEKLKDIF